MSLPPRIEWLEGRGLRRMPPAVFHAVVFGPAQQFSRHWLAGRTPTSIATAERSLAEAAWGALRAALPTAR